MKRILLLIALAALVGCGKKEPVLPFVSNSEKIKLWEFKTGGAIGDSSPTIGSDGTVFFGSYDKKLYAIKTKSRGLAKSPWPMRGQNARHTGHVPVKN